jgi:acetyl-CoA/propionyl-CoA carboxylase biotin carboxyl carrier protein
VATDAGGTRPRSQPGPVHPAGRRFAVHVRVPEAPWAELARARAERRSATAGLDGGAVVSPMQGTVLKVEVADGDAVEAGRVLCVVEAMKMENEIAAHADGVVRRLGVAPGEPIAAGQLICVLEAE